MPPVIAIVGRSDSGKTTLVVKLIAELREEHKELSTEASRLAKLLETREATGTKDLESVQEELENFYNRLRAHAAKENDLFPSLI